MDSEIRHPISNKSVPYGLGSLIHAAVANNDVSMFQHLIDENASIVNDVNERHETPLHLATSRDTDPMICEKLIAIGADANALNLWGQSPIHYAAINESVQAINALLETEAIDVTLTDCNGYNALHCFVSNTEAYTTEWVNVVQSLIDAGIDINSQTTFGYHVLHRLAGKEDNTEFIKFILRNFPEVKPNILDQKGENFLHIYVKSELCEEILLLFQEIALGAFGSCSRKNLQELLNQKNHNGLTPFRIMIETGNRTKENVVQMLDIGALSNITDNYGNSILYRLINVPCADDIVEEILKTGINVNARNIFGQTLSAYLWCSMSFEILMHHNIDLNMTDRWGCSPLVSVMKWRPIPEHIKCLIDAGALTDTQDQYGSTAMHMAAYHDYHEQVQLLLDNGAKQNVNDTFGDTPKDTAIRNFALKSVDTFKTFEQCETIYTRTAHSVFDILGFMKAEVTLPELCQAPTTRALLGLPENIEGFLEDLYSTKVSAFSTKDGEEAMIVQEMRGLVQSICQKVVGYDSRFELTIFPTGSTVEGTKVGCPDEFDFVLCLKTIEQLVEIVKTPDSINTGYACLRFKDRSIAKRYLPFADCDGWFLPYPYLKYLFHYLDRALNEANLWDGGNIYCSFEDKLRCIPEKPVFNFSVYWIGAKHKHLKISVDLVPGVYKEEWWPADSGVNGLPLMNEDVKNAGCFILLQSPKSGIDIARISQMDDNINYVTAGEAFGQWRLLRISAAPAEISLMKSLPEVYRKSYRLGKIFKNKDVFPELRLTEAPSQILALLYQFEDHDFKKETVSPGRLRKSYMLKNCIFYVAQEMGAMDRTSDNPSVLSIMKRMFLHLLYRADDGIFRPYFLPFSDVFEFKKEENMSSRKRKIFDIKRELAIKYLLDILGVDLKPSDRRFYLV